MKESIQCKGEEQAQWPWRKTPQGGIAEVPQKVAPQGIPVLPEASEI